MMDSVFVPTEQLALFRDALPKRVQKPHLVHLIKIAAQYVQVD